MDSPTQLPPGFPPGNPDWPDHLKGIYITGCHRITKLRQQADADGVFPIPFVCYGCDRSRSDFCMMTGDKVPICQECFDRCADAMVNDSRGPVGV